MDIIIIETNSQKGVPARTISIHWGDGRHDEYPAVWLRANCQCPECYNKAARNRMILMQDLDVNVAPEIVIAKEHQVNKKLEVVTLKRQYLD